MKLKLIISLLLLSLIGFGQTTTVNFTQYTGDLARPGAGAETWIYQNTVPGIPGPVDDYYRYHWATDFQPGNSTATQFNWTALDRDFQNSINHNRKASIGVMQTCGACGTDSKPIVAGGGMVYPVFLHNQMQGEATKDFISGGEWIPHYNSSFYLTAWKRLHDSIEYHINHTSYQGVPFSKVIRWIDVNGMGDYGEWTNNAPTLASSDPASIATKDSIIAYVVRGHPNTYCQLLNATFDGNLLANTKNDPLVGYFALNIRNNVGAQGYRRESWGNPASFYDQWTNGNTTIVSGYHFDTAITNRYKYAPITGEMQDNNQSNQMSGLSSQMTTYHVLSFGNGNLDAMTGDATTYANIVAAAKVAGYELKISSNVTTTTPNSGGQFITSLSWRNVGTTPSYDHWKVVYELVQGTTVKFTGISKFDPYLYAPAGSDNVVIDTFTLAGVPAAAGYTLRMSVQDVNGYQRPMPLFITTTQNAGGSYNLRSNITVGNSGAPVAAAGGNQAITLPTSSVTLDGTASSGTITSYAWTQISGPNTATFGTPSAATTSAGGLIAGVYVFQLSLNAGASTATTQVIVNAAIPPGSTIFTTQTPVAATDNDIPGGANPTTGQEVGVRFSSTITGFITGIRFYKTAGNNGTHIGELYSNTGTRLASATFTNETSVGWQTVSLSTPVKITAGVTYVAAYYSSQGYYTEDNDYFLGKGVTNTQLSAPADGTNGASGNDNGTGQAPYAYSSVPTFPNQLFRSANYWVDIVFALDSPGKLSHRKTGYIYFK